MLMGRLRSPWSPLSQDEEAAMAILSQSAQLTYTRIWDRARLRLALFIDGALARVMFWLSLVFLTVSAGVIHRIGHGHTTLFEAEVIVWGLLLLWPVFVLDALVRLVIGRRPDMPRWQHMLYCSLLAAAPPFRMGACSYVDPDLIWLPGLGWRRVDRVLQKHLEHFFSLPMIGISLLVLPVLALEFFWLETVRGYFLLSLALDIGASVIWVAFVIEFVLMVSVSPAKLLYCLQHIIDLAVVALPLVDFLPVLRLVRLTSVLEIQQITRVGRMLRLRGLLLKSWQAVLLMEMIQRLLGDYKRKRLQRLRELVAAHEADLVELRREIVVLEEEVKADARTLGHGV
jgi:voltage-gated potassium channel